MREQPPGPVSSREGTVGRAIRLRGLRHQERWRDLTKALAAIVLQLYYNCRMTQTISFRPDERTTNELRVLTRGRKTSEVLRELIHKSYLEDLYARAVEDAERLRNDSDDRAELAAIAQEMDEIRAW